MRAYVGFNVPVSHQITAGADLLMMPSRFEPCGLNQLYAMAYGTPVIAHETGGLRDTVLDVPYHESIGSEAGTGWTFKVWQLQEANPCSMSPRSGSSNRAWLLQRIL